MSTLQATNLKHGSSASNNLVLDANGNVTAAGTVAMASPFAMRNKIINGDMRIDQRNAGASVTINAAANTYTVDRWLAAGQATDGVFTVQRSTVTPPGFINSIAITVTTADSSIGATQAYYLRQNIEGFNVADLAFGQAWASTITLSFWVRSSVTGTFGGALNNSAFNRSYPFSYTINSANAWEYKTISIAGDTTGTWLTDNGIGLAVTWSLGMGSTYSGTANAWAGSLLLAPTGSTNLIATNGATFYLTGVQLEVGSVATPFERRIFSQELSMCQRYYSKSYDIENAPGTNTNSGKIAFYAASTAGESSNSIPFPVFMRASPTVVLYTPAGVSGAIRNDSDGTNDTGATASSTGQRGIAFIGGSRVSGKIYSFHYTANIEL